MIEIRKLHKSFNGRQVLQGIDLNVAKGSTCVIIGRSGCGKSVLLKHIVGIMRPDSGDVLVEGKNIAKISMKELNALRLKVSMVFQAGALFDSLTVAENVGFNLLEHDRVSRKDFNARVEESLHLVGLSGISERMPAELSGGMKKRVALARAICGRPDVILYDEPTTGVDPITADAINDLIKRLHDKLKVTAIAVTHDMRSAYHIADKISMLYNGKIIAEGTPAQIQSSTDPFVHQFINGLSTGPITDSVGKSL